MFRQDAQGTYYEMGLTNGQQFKEVLDSDDWYPLPFSKEQLEIGRAFEHAIQEYTPDLLVSVF